MCIDKVGEWIIGMELVNFYAIRQLLEWDWKFYLVKNYSAAT